MPQLRTPQLTSVLAGLRDRLDPQTISRWEYEHLLDRFACDLQKAIETAIGPEVEAEIGCSILYRAMPTTYFVGGSSTDRRRLARSNRYYPLDSEPGRGVYSSFTGFALKHGVHLLLDDFPSACKDFASLVAHQSKPCELEEGKTKSYYLLPSFAGDGKPATVRAPQDLPSPVRGVSTVDQLPAGGIRITADKTGIASKIDGSLTRSFLTRTFKVFAQGQEAVLRNEKNNAIAIADFQGSIFEHAQHEYFGLEQLVFHLQSLFEMSECSIFVASREKKTMKLYLGATTALSDSRQQMLFRKQFFADHNFYECPLGNGTPQSHDCQAKTERAYCQPGKPIRKLVEDSNELASVKFPGRGEFRDAKSFMAVGIPGAPGNLSYGVIRTMRDAEIPYTEKDSALAVAVARVLANWVKQFPRNQDLRVNWAEANGPSLLQETVLFKLFGLPRGGHSRAHENADRELRWLLQKIFYRCGSITVRKMLSARSNSVVLLVQNDQGLDLILKVLRLNVEQGERSIDNSIVREIQNYSEHVEGKLPLQHNLIYRELLRESRQLIGFATSFLGLRSQERDSLSNFCKRLRTSPPLLERVLSRAIEELFGYVWAWWYQPRNMAEDRRTAVWRFLEEAFLARDPWFSFFEEMKAFDQKWWSRIKSIVGEFESPGYLWKKFYRWAQRSRRRVLWQETVVHGDCHFDNIFFDRETMEIWILDFERTGGKPNIFDFALLEADLKYRQMVTVVGSDVIRTAAFQSWYSGFEQILAKQKTYECLLVPPDWSPRHGNEAPLLAEQLRALAKVVVDIRQLACQKLGRRGSFLDYHLVSLLLSFKYMKLGDASKEARGLAFLSANELVRGLTSSRR